MRTTLIDLINMPTFLLCKLFSLDSLVLVTSHPEVTSYINKHDVGVINLNPFNLDSLAPL